MAAAEAVASEVAKDPQGFAEALNTLRMEVLLILVIVVLLWRLFAYMERRAEKREKAAENSARVKEEAAIRKEKSARASKLTKALDNLATSLTTHDKNEGEAISGVNSALIAQTETLKEQTEALHAVRTRLKEVSRKTKGMMSPNEGLTVVEAYYSKVCRSVQYLFERSLRENDFAARSDYISRLVRTRIADVLAAEREELRTLGTLGIDADRIFPTYVNQDSTHRISHVGLEPVQTPPHGTPSEPPTSAIPGGERFLLCDVIWDSVVHCYQSQVPEGATQREKESDLRARIAEAQLVIENTMKDHYTALAKQIHEATGNQNDEGTSTFSRPKTGPSGEWGVPK